MIWRKSNTALKKRQYLLIHRVKKISRSNDVDEKLNNNIVELLEFMVAQFKWIFGTLSTMKLHPQRVMK